MSKKYIWSILAVIALCGVMQLMLPPQDSKGEKPAETGQETNTENTGLTWPKNIDQNGNGYNFSGGLMKQFFVAMFLVAVLGTAAYLLSKKLVPKLSISKGRSLSVIETISIGPRKSLHVVEIAGKQNLLIASTNEHISFISDITQTMADNQESSDQTAREQND